MQKEEPLKFSQADQIANTELQNDKVLCLQQQYFIWLVLRFMTSDQASFPTFSGWQLSIRNAVVNVPPQKSFVTYLPPINASVTSFTTIFRYLKYMQKLCLEDNMPFVNVTHISMHEGDYELRLNAWKEILPSFQQIIVGMELIMFVSCKP